jgi:hypothetical protein
MTILQYNSSLPNGESKNFLNLKVGTNEKQGGSQRWQMIGIYKAEKEIEFLQDGDKFQ